MFKLFKECFKRTNDCIILATPLVIFLSIISWYVDYAMNTVNTMPKLVLAVITLLVMSSGFFAAWFYMTKKTLKLSNKVFVFDKDRAKAFWALILSLPKGIGRLFLPFVGVISLSTVIYGLVLFVVTYFVAKYLGTININFFNSDNFFISSKELIEEITNLPREEIIIIYCWYFLVLGCTILLEFLAILWIPEIVYGEKNPFKALYFAIKKLIITFPKTFLLFVYINIISFATTILNTVLMVNPIAYFLVLLLYYYLILYIVVLLFTYYELTFLQDE